MYATAGDAFRAQAAAERKIADHFADPDSRWSNGRETTRTLADQIAINAVMCGGFTGELMDPFTAQLLQDGALFLAQTIKLHELANRAH